MIQEFADRFISQKEAMIADFVANKPSSYDDLFKKTVTVLSVPGEYRTLDPNRITVIDHGDYQGTRLFVVAVTGYQPSTYYATLVSYGSCSGCDSLEAIVGYQETITESQANELWTMCLHMVQKMKEIS